MFLTDTVSVLNLTHEPLQNKEVKRTFNRGDEWSGKEGLELKGVEGKRLLS